MITENLSTLKIHKMTQSQYDRELASGNIDENALYLTPSEVVDSSNYYTKEEVDNSIGDIETALDSIIQIQNTLLGEANEKDLITFTIDGVSYQAEKDMTWGEWCQSEYNTHNFYIEEDGAVFSSQGTGVYYEGYVVADFGVIVSGYAYVTTNYGGNT